MAQIWRIDADVNRMKRFLYVNCELFGAVGISDYSFQCIIKADSKEEALEWGNRVAARYDELHGLMPSGERLEQETLQQNGSLIDIDVSLKSSDARYRCRYGEYPEFTEGR